MADTQNASFLSIGEVLGLLLEEYPDVTISKIRFLESQGLISPERTPSGYRKFYDDDVQLLRVILAEQRQNYLPLRVIKDRLETGQIDPTGEHLRPNGVDDHDDTSSMPMYDEPVEAVPVPEESISSHPAARHQTPSANGAPAATSASEPSGQPAPAAPSPQVEPEPTEAAPPVDAPSVASEPPAPPVDAPSGDIAPEPAESDPTPAAAHLLPGVMLDRSELCSMVGMTDDELSALENFGVVTPRDAAGIEMYGEDAVSIAKPACAFLRAGVDARHLRNWRTSAEREASLFEQLVTPRFRQRNPEARAEALEQLRNLDELGAELRSALTKQVLRHHFEG